LLLDRALAHAESENSLNISIRDRDVLRELGEKKAALAALPIQEQRKKMWAKVNDRKMEKPMVWITELPWHEIEDDPALALKSENRLCRAVERLMRRELYQWEHLQADMVVEPYLPCLKAINNSDIGIWEEVDVAITDEKSDIISRRFKPLIANEEDEKKIKMPMVSHNREKTDQAFEMLSSIFDGVLPVKIKGHPGYWFSPWDRLVRLTGVQQILTDLVARPDYVHKVIGRMTRAFMIMLDQYEEHNLLALNNSNQVAWSGAYGYTEELPREDQGLQKVLASDLWGFATAQIFAVVSPAMHEEFALDYEIQWLKRFGLTYYGCCEPLHNKIEMLRRIPNLRKISLSPTADMEKAADAAGGDYVFSLKPNPAFLAENDWRPEAIRKDLKSKLSQSGGCSMEIVLKDISTIRYEPNRLRDWARIAAEVTEEFAA